MHSLKLCANFADKLKACHRQLQNFLPLGKDEAGIKRIKLKSTDKFFSLFEIHKMLTPVSDL